MPDSIRILIAFVAIMMLGACSESTESPPPDPIHDVLRVALESAPTTLDPLLTVDAPTLQLHLNTYALLYRQLSDGTLRPSLAKSATSPDDGLTWEFILRDNVRFCGVANERTVTAADVAATLQRAANHPSSRVAWLFERVEKGVDGALEINAEGADRLRVRFAVATDAPRYFSLPQLGVLPAELASDPDYVFRSSVGAGPYRITEYTPGRIELAACRAGDRTARISLVELTVTRDLEVAFSNYAQGGLDLVPLSFGKWKALKSGAAKSPRGRLVEQAGAAHLEFLLFNSNAPGLADPDLRRAMLYALDRSQLCNRVLLGVCDPANFISARPGNESDASLYRPSAAMSALERSTVVPAKLRLLSFPDEFSMTYARWAARAWEYGQLLGTLFGGQEFDMATLWVAPLVDVPEIWNLAWQPGDPPPGGRNVARIDIPGFAGVYEQLKTVEGAESAILISEAERLLESNPPAVPLFQRRFAWLLADGFDWNPGPILALELWRIAPSVD